MGIGNVSAMVLFLSFAIDRVTKALLFLSVSFEGPWSRWLPDPLKCEDSEERARAERRQILGYYLVAGVLVLLSLVGFQNVRLLENLKYPAPWFLDACITGIVLLGGSDLVSKVLQVSGLTGGMETRAQPLEITGKVILENAGPRTRSDAERTLT